MEAVAEAAIKLAVMGTTAPPFLLRRRAPAASHRPWHPTPNLGDTIAPEVMVQYETAGRLNSAGSVA
jgi:hypothetical protein